MIFHLFIASTDLSMRKQSQGGLMRGEEEEARHMHKSDHSTNNQPIRFDFMNESGILGLLANTDDHDDDDAEMLSMR
jgi:hypothetical protein